MPYKSDAQRRYFNANRDELEAQGVDVDEWNDSSRGKKLPERAKKKKRKKKASISLGTSRVHGTGLFTNVNIKKGTKFARAMVRMRGKDAQSRYELTKAARYTNHSQVPSAQMVKAGNEIYLVALKDIPANAEVLVDYRKTASVLGPGSYITFKGKKRTTWEQLEKQAQEGVSFRDRLGAMDPTARNALLGGGAGAVIGGGVGLLGSLGGPGRNKIDAGMAAHLLNQGVPAATVRKLQAGQSLNDSDHDALTQFNVDLDEIAPKGSYLMNMLDSGLAGGMLVGGATGAVLGGGLTELDRAVLTPASIRENAARRAAGTGQQLQEMLPGWVPPAVGEAGQVLAQGAGKVTGEGLVSAYKALPRTQQFDMVRDWGMQHARDRSDRSSWTPAIDAPLELYDKLFGKKSSADPIERAIKQADMLKDLGEGIAKGVEGLAGQVGKSLDELKEAEEEKDKEQEKLDKAVARNVRERKARKIAKKYAALATYGVDMGMGLSTADIATSSNQLRRLMQWRPKKKKKKKRSGKNYEQELNLQEQRTVDKLLFEEERHENLMEELKLRQMLAKTGGILPEEGPIANILTAVGAKKSKRKKEEEAERRKAQRAAQVAADAARNVKMGALLAKKALKLSKAANQAAPQQSYANPQPSLTAQRQGAHNAMNNQAAGVGSQQPPLTPEDSQVLGQRPQATPSANQRPLNPTVANLGAGPLTGDQFGPGAESGLGMALTASARSQGDLIDMALRCIEKRAFGYGDDYSSTGRYLDGGEIWGMKKRDAIEFTQHLQEEAAKNKLDLLFSGDRFDTSYAPDEALRRMEAAGEDLDDAEHESYMGLPHYYSVSTRKPGWLRGLLGAERPKFPDKHPLDTVYDARVPAMRAAEKEEEKKAVDYLGLGLGAGGLAGVGVPYLLDAKPTQGAVFGSMAGGTALGGLIGHLANERAAKKQRKKLKRKVPKELTDQERRDLDVLDDLAEPRGEKEAETSLLPGPFDLAGTAIAGGIGGAGIGALINAVRGRSLKRGLITGGLTGAGTLSGHELGSNLSRNRAAEFAGGWGGTGFGGYGGYQLAQAIQGPDEEEKKKKKKRAKKASADPLEFVLSITKSSAPTPEVKRRRKGAPRSVTIKKPSRVCPDTGKVTPGSSSIKHIARTGKKIR